MSKIYAKYLELKEKNPNKLYLFKSGKFYIFIADDCDKFNEYMVLKKVKFCNETYKCGFPENVLEDYLRVFSNHKLDIELVENTDISGNTVHEIIKNTDINKITPIEALKILEKLKEIVNNEK